MWNLKTALASYFGSAFWWLCDKIWGDRIFSVLKPMIPDWVIGGITMSDALRAAQTWVPFIGLIVIGTVLYWRGMRLARTSQEGDATVNSAYDQATPTPNTQFDALKFQYRDEPPFVSVEPLKDGRLRRAISIAIVNSGNGYISNVSARVKSIVPDTGMHMPLKLDCGIFDLKARGQDRLLHLFTHPMSSESAIRISIPFTGTLDYHPFIPKGAYFVSIEVTGDQTKAAEVHLRLWVDESDQLRAAMV